MEIKDLVIGEKYKMLKEFHAKHEDPFMYFIYKGIMDNDELLNTSFYLFERNYIKVWLSEDQVINQLEQ